MKILIALICSFLFFCVFADTVSKGICKLEEPIFTPATVREYRHRAELNDPEGQYLYAKALCFGLGTKKSPEKAVEWAKKSAEQNCAAGVNLLAVCLLNGWGVEKNFAKAVEKFNRAIALGDVRAIANLAGCYMKGDGVSKDVDRAIEMYKEAASAGVTYAMNELGRYYRKQKDGSSAFMWFSLSDELGDDDGRLLLGICYVEGYGCKMDYKKGKEIFESLADKGYSGGEYMLGALYENGWGIDKDMETALAWYRKAAEHGHENARKCVKRLDWKIHQGKSTTLQATTERRTNTGGFGHSSAAEGEPPQSIFGLEFGSTIEEIRSNDNIDVKVDIPGSRYVIGNRVGAILMRPFRKFKYVTLKFTAMNRLYHVEAEANFEDWDTVAVERERVADLLERKFGKGLGRKSNSNTATHWMNINEQGRAVFCVDLTEKRNGDSLDGIVGDAINPKSPILKFEMTDLALQKADNDEAQDAKKAESERKSAPAEEGFDAL